MLYLRPCASLDAHIKKQKIYKELYESARKIFIERIKDESKNSLAYVDETGIDTYLYRERARAPRVKKVGGEVLWCKFARQSIVAAKCGNKVLAPFGYTGIYDANLFGL